MEFDDLRGELPRHGERELKILAFPLLQWLFGGLVVVVALVFAVEVVEGSLGLLQKRHGALQYTICAAILAVGMVIIGAGKFERVSFSKSANSIVVAKRSPCSCNWDVRLERRLFELRSITLESLGRESVNSDTTHYKLALHFVDGSKHLTLESKNRGVALQRLRSIRQFVFGDESGLRDSADIVASRQRLASMRQAESTMAATTIEVGEGEAMPMKMEG